MYIKMRTIKVDTKATCDICGATKKQSLELFEIMFNPDKKVTICDLCNEKLLTKTLRANCMINERLKTKQDITIIRKRKEVVNEENK